MPQTEFPANKLRGNGTSLEIEIPHSRTTTSALLLYLLFRGPLHHVRASECRQRHRLFPRIHFCLIDPSLSTEPTATTAISEKEPSSDAYPVALSVGRSSDKVPRIVRRVTCPCLLLSPPDRRQEVLVVGLSDFTRTHDSAAGLQLAKEGAVAQYISP